MINKTCNLVGNFTQECLEFTLNESISQHTYIYVGFFLLSIVFLAKLFGSKITNKKEPYALVWNDPIWELRKKKSVVKDLVDKGYMMIDTTHDTIDEKNTNYIKFQDNFEDNATNIKDKIEDGK